MLKLKIFLASLLLGIALTAGFSGQAAAVDSTAPCNAPNPAFAGYHKFVVWTLENHSAATINSSDMPYLTGLASQCELMTNEFALHHPSLPNYLDMTAGSNFGILDDGTPAQHPLPDSSIFSQLGKNWKGYHNGMQSNCALVNGGDHYIVHHNPAAYYTYKTATYDFRSVCQTNDLPLEGHLAPDFAAGGTAVKKLSYIVPNNCHNGHPNSCGGTKVTDLSVLAKQADDYLKANLPTILDSPAYANGDMLVIITWDEGKCNSCSNAQAVYTVLVSPQMQGFVISNRYTHYSILKYLEQKLGKAQLRGAATAADMSGEPGL